MSSYQYSLIIPVLKMEDNPYLNSILDQLDKQSVIPESVHLVVGDKRQGRAINYGVSRATTKYIGTVDDDTLIDDSDLFEKLLNAVDGDPSIGMAGAACEIPEFASSFQKRAMLQIPRRYFPVQKENVDSDMVQHPCLIMPRQLFSEIGGEDEELIRGLDPLLRKKVRDAGKRVVIVANCWVYHLIPDSLSRLLKMYYRNGRGSGYASRNFPERVFELSNGYDEGEFVEKRNILFRLFRRCFSLFMAIITFKYIKVLTDIAYILGVLKEKISPSYIVIPKVEKVVTTKEDLYSYKLYVHHVHLVE